MVVWLYLDGPYRKRVKLEFFLEMYPTIRMMKLYPTARSYISEWLKKIEKKGLVSDSGLADHSYLWDTSSVLKRQLSCTNGDDLILYINESSERWHAMSSKIELHACQHAMCLVRSSGDTDFFPCKSASLDRTDFAIAFLQTLTDNSPA